MNYAPLLALGLLACDVADPGISEEKAMAVLQGFGYTDIKIAPTPRGWEGTASPGPDTYLMKVVVDRQGVLYVEPAPTH